MKKIILFLSVFFILNVNAESIYSLDGLKKVYLVVDISGNKLLKKYKQEVMKQLNDQASELGLDTSGYDQRSLAIVINEKYIGTTQIVNVRLLVGEQVKREGMKSQSFALTYLDNVEFLLSEDIDLDEMIEDSVDTLLERFTDQYQEENKVIDIFNIQNNQFATMMKYETDYEKAMQRAKKEQKNIMLVLVANFCPWCSIMPLKIKTA